MPRVTTHRDEHSEPSSTMACPGPQDATTMREVTPRRKRALQPAKSARPASGASSARRPASGVAPSASPGAACQPPREGGERPIAGGNGGGTAGHGDASCLPVLAAAIPRGDPGWAIRFGARGRRCAG